MGKGKQKTFIWFSEEIFWPGLMSGVCAAVLVRAEEPALHGRVVPLLIVMSFVAACVGGVILKSGTGRLGNGVTFLLGWAAGAGLGAAFLPTAVANFMLLPYAFWGSVIALFCGGAWLVFCNWQDGYSIAVPVTKRNWSMGGGRIPSIYATVAGAIGVPIGIATTFVCSMLGAEEIEGMMILGSAFLMLAACATQVTFSSVDEPWRLRVMSVVPPVFGWFVGAVSSATWF